MKYTNPYMIKPLTGMQPLLVTILHRIGSPGVPDEDPSSKTKKTYGSNGPFKEDLSFQNSDVQL